MLSIIKKKTSRAVAKGRHYHFDAFPSIFQPNVCHAPAGVSAASILNADL
jgi:hypothetical protein